MTRHFYIIFCFVFLLACDDGDILNIELEFDQELKRCENDIDSYLIYDTREDPNESLSLIIPRTDLSELLFTIPTPVGSPVVFDIDASTVRFIYRTYNRAVISTGSNEELCDVIPPASLTVVEDYEANSGTVIVTTTIEDDDNDGIPSVDEDLNGNGNFDDDHSDTDGIPDYLDEDDDNDNIKTSIEINGDENLDGDDDPSTNPLDSDLDGTPDYLDDDDDDDGVLTRLEDIDSDLNPRGPNDLVVDENGVNIYRYLYNHPTAMEAFADSGFLFNIYTRSVTTSFIIENAGLEIINSTVIEFGTYEASFEISNEPED